jgi:hypothetical protein
MAKKTKSKSKRKFVVKDGMPEGIYGGHRDLAELWSAEYGLTLPRVGWDTMEAMFDMDQLTGFLEQMDPKIIDETAKDRWAQGFMMGMLHQLILTRVMELDEEGNEIEED